MANKHFHIVPNDGRWSVKQEGRARPLATRNSQNDALEAAEDMADDGDVLIVHREDGAIQENITFSADTQDDRRRTRRGNVAAGPTPDPSDVLSVGTRVSWSSVIAGVLVATGVYFVLNLLLAAIGLTIDLDGRFWVVITGLVLATINLLISSFLGGFVASRMTAGENPAEAVTYGVLVWATGLLLLAVTGTGVGVGMLSGTKDMGATQIRALSTDYGVGETDPVSPQTRRVAEEFGPTYLAWAAFFATVTSLLAALGGAYSGAGPELAFAGPPDKRNLVVKDDD